MNDRFGSSEYRHGHYETYDVHLAGQFTNQISGMLSGCRDVLHSKLPMACVVIYIPRADNVSSYREQNHCGNSVPK